MINGPPDQGGVILPTLEVGGPIGSGIIPAVDSLRYVPAEHGKDPPLEKKKRKKQRKKKPKQPKRKKKKKKKKIGGRRSKRDKKNTKHWMENAKARVIGTSLRGHWHFAQGHWH